MLLTWILIFCRIRMKTKAELREHIIRKRAALSTADWQLASQKICTNFFTLIEPAFSGTIHVFLPIIEKKEPDTWLIINKLWRQYPAVEVVASKTLWKQRKLQNYLLKYSGTVKANKWGIPEPTNAELYAREEFDMVLVPLLAFDHYGQRLGYGGGFYDRFLSSFDNQPKIVGLSLFEALEEGLPEVNEHDVPLHYCITPEAIYNFSI